MTQRGPWSVKGIDSRAREVAREAAREEGMTLGAYLNRLILEEGIAETAAQSAQFGGAAHANGHAERAEPRASSAAHTGHPLSGHPHSAQATEPSSTALDRLTRRIESAEARSTLAITGIDQSVVGLLSRLENAEHNQQAMGGHFEGVMDDIQKTYEALSIKVKRVEEDDSSATNLRALKALEDALGKLASHVYEENELVGEETSAIKARLESGLAELTERMGDIDNQIEAKLEDATGDFQQAISQAELRTEGISKHLAERFTSVELDVAEKLAHVGQMGATMDGVHANVTSSLTGINDTLGNMQERLSRAETLTDKAMHGLEARFENLDERLASVAVFANEDADQSMRRQFEDRFETLSDDLRQLVASTRAELAQEIEAAAKSVDAEVLTRIEGAIGNLSGRLNASEDLHAQTMEMVGDTVSRVTESVDQRLSATQEQQKRSIEQVGQQVSRISDSFDQRLDKIEQNSGKVETDALREEIIRFTNTLDERLEYLETREDETFEKVGSDVEKLADRLDQRVTESEKRSASAIAQVGEQLSGVAQRIAQRQAEAIQALSSKMESTQTRQDQRLTGALGNVSDRLARMQEQSLNSLSPVQKAIAALAQRIEAIEDFSAPPYATRGQTPNIPAMVTPSKIDTDISLEPMAVAQTKMPARPADNMPAQDLDSDEIEPQKLVIKSAPEKEKSDSFRTSILDRMDLLASDLEVDMSSAQTEASTAFLDHGDENDVEIEEFEAGFQTWSDNANTVLDNALGTDDDPEAEVEAEYYTDLPPPLDMQSTDDDTDEDIFGADESAEINLPPLGAEIDKLNAFEASSTFGDVSAPQERPDDYISRARQAAKAAAENTANTNLLNSKKKGSGDGAKGADFKRTGLVALAAVAVVGTAGAFYLRNQNTAPDTSVDIASPAVKTPVTAGGESPNNAAPLNTAITDAREATSEAETQSQTEDTSPASTNTNQEPTLALPSTSGTAPAPKPTSDQRAQDAAAQRAANTARKLRNLAPIPETVSLGASAQQGNPVAQYQSGMADLRGGSFQTGADWLRKAANQNIPMAQHELAILHENGTGTTRDFAEARRWHGIAAEGGNVESMFDFATYNANAEGGEANMQIAAEWFRKAAEFGHTDSQYNLAQLYTEGTGVSPSQVEAYYWFQLAAKGGDADARNLAQGLLAEGQISQEAATQINQRVANWRPASPNSAANGRFPPQAWDGNTSGQLLAVQKTLDALEYNIGTADGIMGAQTRAAIGRFEQSAGLPVTGEVTDALIDALNIAAERAKRAS